MPKTDRPPDRPEVIDLNARRRAAEVRKQALEGAARASRKPGPITPLAAWGVLLAAAAIWTAVSTLAS